MGKLTVQSSNLTYFIICLLGIAAFFFVGIFPNFSALRDMDDEIAQLHDKVKTQEMLFPVYQKLVQEITTQVPTTLPLPEKQKISHNDLAGINEMFDRLARENHVVFNRAVPDVSNYLNDTGYLAMNVDFTGDFFDLRNLLMSICQMPYLETIDEMRIETRKQTKHIEFKIKINQE